MVGAVVFTYGFLMSFVFAGASRNAKLRRANPPIVQYVGYLLCGISIGTSVALLAHAVGLHLGMPLLAL